ncbi:hypothetical protein C1645_808064 [Glomus cerebriforme]|uniref:Protein kinase domain-containing protein n=1 Tax=Glomus cerebriforme TaxID=658196 RepID=A0A397SSH3_9GLOM|nr:hypothetical protein C1645_808064 [Glomus cerebriforme]
MRIIYYPNFATFMEQPYLTIKELIYELRLGEKQESQFINNAKWIKHDVFENVKYITKGGKGIISKVKWKDGFIIEWNYETNQWIYLYMNNSPSMVKIYAISKDSKTIGFMTVMQYAVNGNLRQSLNDKFEIMSYLACGLNDIHDFHSDQLLVDSYRRGKSWLANVQYCMDVMMVLILHKNICGLPQSN